MAKSTAAVKLPSLKETVARLPSTVRAALEACTPLQQRFIIQYCGPANGNGTLAAQMIKAGSTHGAWACRASQMLREPTVRAAVDAWMDAFGMTAAEVTARLADLARADLGPFLKRNAQGALELVTPDDQTWAAYKHWIKAVELDPETGAVVRLTLHDSLSALKELAKILKLYSEAPVFNFNVHLQTMTDEELLAEYAAIKANGQLRENGRIAPPRTN